MPEAAPDLKHLLRSEALKLGLDTIGFAGIEPGGLPGRRLAQFLSEGRHGDMDWMAANADRRADPLQLWPEAKTAIMVGQSYAPDSDPLDALEATDRGVVSVYAHGRDYHDIVKSRIKALAGILAAASGAEVKVFVDTAPLMEKPLAAAAGIGWQGKHTNLVSRSFGSWLFLGAILTAAEIAPDDAEADHCGSCSRCLDACPTKAFPAPYQLDARRCLAYLSIEHRGHIPLEFRAAMGNRVFGCDDCLAVCPWNKFAATAREIRFAATDATRNPPLAEFLALDDAAFRKRFAGTPVKRTGRDRVVRNALIAAGNSRDRQLLPAITALMEDPSPLVRAMAVWSARRLATDTEFTELRDLLARRETDADVASEWQDAGGARSGMSHLFCFGLGYTAGYLARRLQSAGWRISGTSQSPEGAAAIEANGFRGLVFDGSTRIEDVAIALQSATHVLLSIPPGPSGDPALMVYGDDIAHSPSIGWIGYLSTVGVYGDAAGGWVDETTEARPGSERGTRRLAAENDWQALGHRSGKPVFAFRLPGIYGPGRSAVDDLRAGKARRVIKPGQVFNRAHVSDIAGAVAAALPLSGAGRTFNVTDDLPAAPQDVIAYAASLLGMPCPPPLAYEAANLSPIATSFFSESKRVSNARMKAELAFELAYPTYKEGLAAIARGMDDSPPET